MRFTIKINPRENALLYGDRGMDLMVLRHAECHLRGLLEIRGYLYANFIYEYLCVEWNPSWDNEVLLHDSHNRLAFDIAFEDDCYIVQIIY